MRALLFPLSVACAVGASAPCVAAELPTGWYRNKWPGYQPYAAIETVDGPLPGRWAMHVSDVQSKHGFGILSAMRLPAADGDRLRVTFLARGTGQVAVSYVSFTADGQWNQGAGHQTFEVSDDWRLVEAELPVSDRFHPKKTGKVQVDLGGSQGGAFWFSDIRAEVVKGTDAPGGLPEVRELKDRRTAFREDFEKAVRGGEPKATDTAPGLLERTQIGVYRTDRERTLPFRATAALPTAADAALSCGYRLYSLKGAVTLTCAATARALALSVHSEKAANVFDCAFRENGQDVAAFRLPRNILPADVRLDVNGTGGWGVEVVSLADSSVRRFRGMLAAPLPRGTATVTWQVAADAGQNGGVALDELAVFTSRVVAKRADMPIKIDRFETFDPVKAGWPLVMSDDFDGAEIDWNRWYYPHYAGQHRECVHTDGEGHLVVETRMGGKGRLVTDGIWTAKALTYGYFEARVKFTKKPGWWAAFWLYGAINTNPFIDGFEIDIFEDYYTRPKDGSRTSAAILDHNVHVGKGGTLKSWNFNARIPEDPDGWHVIGCKWTPFEISYYMDGKLMSAKAQHAGYDSVTFDAARHFTGISPLHTIVSGQISGPDSQPTGLEAGAPYESYFVDWVRLYAYPQPPDEQPTVAWTRGDRDAALVPPGTMLRFAVDAQAKKGGKVAGVYLFDNGYLIDCRTEPPYAFDVRFSEAAYAHTRWAKPGRSGHPPAFDASAHVFVAFVQDEAGRVAHTEPLWRIPVRPQQVPFEGRPEAIPGKVSAIRFDAGGRGVSNYTQEGRNAHWAPTRTNDTVTAAKAGYVGTLYGGDWLNYTVDVAEAGLYRVRAKVDTSLRQQLALRLFLDGVPVGRLALDSFTEWKCGERDDLGETTVRLPQGRHLLTVGLEGGVSFRYIEFIPVETAASP